MPIPLQNDEAAVETALSRVPVPANARMVRIINTSKLDTFWASEAILPELETNLNISVDNRVLQLSFDENGRINPMAN
jgi:hypothetical protein